MKFGIKTKFLSENVLTCGSDLNEDVFQFFYRKFIDFSRFELEPTFLAEILAESSAVRNLT